jgi:rhodanese-related sulfurtransferase
VQGTGRIAGARREQERGGDAQALIPLAGLVFAATVFLAYGVVSGDSPDIDASPGEVASFYSDNSGAEQATALLLALAAPFLAIFAVALRRALSPPGGRSAAATLALLGGGVAVAGFLAQAGVHLALAEGADEEWQESDLPGALHIPGPELGSRIEELSEHKRLILVGPGEDVERAIDELRDHGHEAAALEGGMKAWENEDFPRQPSVDPEGPV